MSVLIGLISPVVIGYADHVGTNLGRRGRLMATVLWIYISTLVTTAVLALLWGGEPTTTDLLLGAGSGIGASMALVQLYRGYTTRGVGIVGPVAAVTGSVIPIAVDAVRVGLPSVIVGSGMVVGVIALWLIGLRNPTGEWDRIAVRHGLMAGLLFGFTATMLGLTSDGSGIWPVLPGRVTAIGTVILVILVGRHPIKPVRGSIPRAGFIGLLGGIGLGSFTLAAQENLAIAGLFFQMAYGFTLVCQVVLAGERTTRIQVAGFGLAIVALAMILLG